MTEAKRASVYKAANGVELKDDEWTVKWTKRGAFYLVYYTLLYFLFVATLAFIETKTHSASHNVPNTQALLHSPRMTLFPVDQIHNGKGKSDNHIRFVAGHDWDRTAEYATILEEKLTRLNHKNFSASVREFCEGDYAKFVNGKACFLVGVNAIVNWKPLAIDETSDTNSFTVKIGTATAPKFDMASQGLNSSISAPVHFSCRVFPTTWSVEGSINSVKVGAAGVLLDSIEWLDNQNYLSSYDVLKTGVNPKGDKAYEDCKQSNWVEPECNINERDYTNWNKPMTAMRLDMNAIKTELAANHANFGSDERAYEFKCNAYAQNIITPMYDEATKEYYEYDAGNPVVTSKIHQEFIIQYK